MRIAMMLRALDEKGGVAVYARYITEELLELDQQNHYFLYYSSPEHLGRYAKFPNVTERMLKRRNKIYWDQVAVPRAGKRDKVDVIFHPKFTVPLLTGCKTAMVLHGAGWFIPEFQNFWKPLDLKYIRTVMPLYCRKASAILSVSQVTTDVFNETLKVTPGKIRTVYFGPGKQFRPVDDPAVLQAVREKYRLPERYIFTLSKYPGGDRKNIDGILEAFRICHPEIEHKLVIGGKDCHNFLRDYNVPEDGYGSDIVFPGYIDQADLPAVYTMADLYLYPSNMEAFPIPITEALACGKPIITSDQNGLREIAGDAALRVNARDPQAIADAICKVLQDDKLRKTLSHNSLERSKMFSWKKCARETLGILESLNADG
ncbi:MAG: glycosyltransferase family 4 protein [Calditrichaeota bacterium]|nr:glycosyltransferase family 4 protein [Calditrichota bacterium]